METERPHWTSNPHGLIFDATVLVGWMLLFLMEAVAIPRMNLSFSSSPESLPAPQQRMIGLLLAAGIATQLAGALLKANPLRARLHQQGTALPSTFLSLFWWVHLIYFAVVTSICLGLFGWIPEDSKITLNYMLWGTTVFAVGGATTFAVKAAATPSSASKAWAPSAEYWGDGLLSLSALLLTSVMWEPMSGWLMDNQVMIEAGFWNWMARLVVVLCVLVLFLVFYLPSRILFLVEDARAPATWARIGCILLPLVWHLLSH